MHSRRPQGAHPNQDHWISIRLERLKFAGHKCEACNLGNDEGVSLECHHRHYETFGDESLTDVLILCRECHEEITSLIMRRRERYLKRYRSQKRHVKRQECDRIMTSGHAAKPKSIETQKADRVVTATLSARPKPIKKMEIDRIM